METDEQGIEAMDTHASNKAAATRVSIEESMVGGWDARRDPEANTPACVPGHTHRRGERRVSGESRAAPGTVPGTSLDSGAAASFTQQEDVSGRLGAIKVGATKGLVLKAPNIMEPVANRVGGALG